MIVALAFHNASYLPFSTTPSLPVLAFAFALALLTGVIFGSAPAWLATRRDPVEALRGANRSTSDHSSAPRKALLVVQAAVSVVLVAGAAMMTRSLGNLEQQDFGFRADGLVNVSFNPPPSSYSPERLDALYRDLQDRLQTIPGVERASLALYAPLTNNWSELIFVDGHPPPKMSEDSAASWDRVSAGFFETVGQTVLRGRGITERDTRNRENVAVVNEAFVRRFFPNENPIDKHFGIDLPEYSRTYRIVGVVRDAKYTQPRRPARPMFFISLAQSAKYDIDLLQKLDSRSHFISAALLRTRMKPGELEPLLRKAFAEADATLSVVSVDTMQEQIAFVFDQQRAVASLAGLFGLVALILAAVGLYGVTAYTVVQRTSEIGIRMALGADAGGVLRLVLRSAFRMVAVGLVLGIPLAIGAGRLISAQLYGVSAWDPVALRIHRMPREAGRSSRMRALVIMPRSPTSTISERPNRWRSLSTWVATVLGSEVLPAKTSTATGHPAALVRSPNTICKAPDFVVTRVTEFGQRTVAPFEVSGGQIIEHQAALGEMEFGKGLLDARLLREQPVHCLVQFGFIRGIQVEDFTEAVVEGIGVKPASGSKFGAWCDDACNDHGDDEIALAAGSRVEDGIQTQVAQAAEDRGDMAVRQ